MITTYNLYQVKCVDLYVRDTHESAPVAMAATQEVGGSYLMDPMRLVYLRSRFDFKKDNVSVTLCRCGNRKYTKAQTS